MIIRTVKLNLKILFILIIVTLLIMSLILSYVLANTEAPSQKAEKKDFIKWVDFKITSSALEKTAKLDIDSHNNNEKVKYNWIELLAYLACKNGGDFKKFKQKDLDSLIEKLK